MDEQQNCALLSSYSRLLINAYSWEDSGSLVHFKLEQALPPKPDLLTLHF